MLKRADVICTIVFLCLPLFAQAPASKDAPSREEVLKFIEAMHVRRQMEVVMKGMVEQMKSGFVHGAQQKSPSTPPEKFEKLADMFDEIFGVFSTEELVEQLVPIYQKHFTRAELAAITQFYSSPVGQGLLEKMPAVSQEAMQVGGAYGRSKFQEIQPKIDARIAEFVKNLEAEQKSPTDAPAKTTPAGKASKAKN